MRNFYYLICLCLLFATDSALAQGNPNNYELSLAGFSMPSAATLNSKVKVQGQIVNIGKKPIPPNILINYKVSGMVPNIIGDELPTFAYRKNTNLLLPGESIDYEFEIYVDDEYFTANQKNIVTIWPLMEKNQDPNTESIYSTELYVHSGMGAKQRKGENSPELETQALVSVYPNPATNTVFVENREKDQDVNYIIAYDINGAIVLEESVEIANRSTKALDISSLVLGKYELAFFNSKGILIRTQKIVKIE